MSKFLTALLSGLIVGMSSAALAQSTTAPVGATPPTSTTSRALTPTTLNPVITTNASTSQLPSFLVQSPPETIRLNSAVPGALSLVIGTTSANTTVLNGDVLTSSTPPAGGLALNALLRQTSGLATPAAPSATSPSFYPSILGAPTSAATFLSQFQGGSSGRRATSTTGVLSPASPSISRITTSRSAGR